MLAAHPLRTALSVSGLLIGVAAVIVMVALSEGAERRLLQRMQAMGTNLLVVNAAPAPRVAGRPRQVPIVTTLRAADAAAIVDEITLARAAAPAVSRSVVVHWEGLNTTTTLLGTTTGGLRIRNIGARSGRLFDDHEADAQARVVVLGRTVVRALFAGVDPVGRFIRIGQVPFEVVGVARPLGTDPGGADMDDRVVIPLATAMRRVLNVPYIHSIFVQARSSADLGELERQVHETLRRRLDVRAGTPEPFLIQNQAVLLQTERGTASAMNRLAASVAMLALVLGGIGIVAVMLISVRERTREIGLRRALGATRRDIRLQFVLESTILAAGGGGAGMVGGLVVAGAAAAAGPWDLVVPWSAACAGFAASAFLGLAVGAVPASRAARLEPVEALRA